MVRVAVVWIVLAGAYVLFVGSLGMNEALAGTLGASVATFWWYRVSCGGLRFEIRRASLGLAARAAAGFPVQSARTAAHLGRSLLGGGDLGSIRTRPLSATGWPQAAEDDRTGTAGRALGVLAASLTPDSYVMRLDTARGEVVEHALGDGSAGRED